MPQALPGSTSLTALDLIDLLARAGDRLRELRQNETAEATQLASAANAGILPDTAEVFCDRDTTSEPITPRPHYTIEF